MFAREASRQNQNAQKSGEEALTMISSHCPDLILLDLGLPDMDGMEVLRSVRKWSNLPVVVVSARNHEQDIEKNPGQPEYIFTEVGVGYRMREGD